VDIQTIGPEDIASCQRIIDASLGDLHLRYGLPDDEVAEPDWIHPILSHFLETDPSGTLGAAVNGELDAFASSFRRDDYWFLSFLFVHPSVQGHGLGRALLDTVSPKGDDVVRATVVESFQPVSTGLYASVGIVPRSIKYWLSGISRPASLPRLSDDIRRAELTATDRDDVDALDRAVLGFDRAIDHAWWSTGSRGWSFRRGETLVGYAYVDDGYLGPALAIDEQTMCLVVADVVGSSDDPASMSINLSGNSRDLFRMLMQAGARIDDSVPYRYVYSSSEGPLPSTYIHHADWLP
jgi:GNAT superfamily N-acetyltransferase